MIAAMHETMCAGPGQTDHKQNMHVEHLGKRADKAAQADKKKARDMETY